MIGHKKWQSFSRPYNFIFHTYCTDCNLQNHIENSISNFNDMLRTTYQVSIVHLARSKFCMYHPKFYFIINNNSWCGRGRGKQKRLHKIGRGIFIIALSVPNFSKISHRANAVECTAITKTSVILSQKKITKTILLQLIISM